MSTKINIFHGLFTLILVVVLANSQTTDQIQGLIADRTDITVLVDHSKPFDIIQISPLKTPIRVTLVAQHPQLVDLVPTEFTISQNESRKHIIIQGRHPGELIITATSEPNEPWIVKDFFVRVIVANSRPLIYVAFAFGIVYFISWSVSFYPQIYSNFKRKSVVGLNFDFVALNIVGFAMYSLFNCGLFWVPEIQDEYKRRHPRGLNPVLPNDVVFSLHALFASIVTFIQCFMYERGGQRVSKTAIGLISVFAIVVIVSAGLATGNVLHWLDFLYYCSYVKLVISLVKYVPQALMNYRLKSTAGWSIGNIILDFIGGILSIGQMLVNAYNYDDWNSIMGDPTKFGMGLFSVLFDLFFMLQHYVFYRHSNNNSNDTLASDVERQSSKSPST